MSRKDYIRLADALRMALEISPDHCVEAEQETHASGVMLAAEQIADEIERENSRFNREHFLAVVRGEKELYSRPPRNGGGK